MPDRDAVAARTRRARLVVALAIVYVVWGSVYLGIRLVIDEVDVFQAMAQRFAMAGVLLIGFVAIRWGPGALRLTRSQLGSIVVLGVLLLGLGNGLQALGQHHGLPSGVTALVVASVPLWAAMIRAATGDVPSFGTVAGILVGFVGLLVLVLLGRGVDGGFPLGAMLLVLVASISWTIGSFYQGVVDLPENPFVIAGYQQLVAALCSVLLAAATGERFSMDYTVRGWISLAYLVVVCSIVGFSAFAWLLRNAPLSLVATHAYVNPVVAVFLGWLVLGEAVTSAVVLGGGIVLGAVVVVIVAEGRRAPRPAENMPSV